MQLSLFSDDTLLNKGGDVPLFSSQLEQFYKTNQKLKAAQILENLPNSLYHEPVYKNRKLWSEKHIKDISLIVSSKGGRWEHLGYRGPVNSGTLCTFYCHKGHEWTARVASIKTGSWCPECGKKIKRTQPKDYLDTLRIKNESSLKEIVNERGGIWVSGVYEGIASVLTLQCKDGHVWQTKAGIIKEGKWCPVCAKASIAIKTRRAGVLRRLNKQIRYYNSSQYIFDRVNKQIKNAHSKITVTKEHKRSVARAWYHRNAHRTREAARQRHKDKYKNDLSYRVNELIKSQLRKCMVKDRPIGKYYDILGYTADELLQHLESLFVDGMSWENQGKWHIDHRTPKSWFNLLNADGSINYEEVRECWSLKNLQPLWAVDNIAKGNRYTS